MGHDEETVRKLDDARNDEERQEAVNELDAAWCRALVVVDERRPRGRELLRGRCGHCCCDKESCGR